MTAESKIPKGKWWCRHCATWNPNSKEHCRWCRTHRDTKHVDYPKPLTDGGSYLKGQ